MGRDSFPPDSPLVSDEGCCGPPLRATPTFPLRRSCSAPRPPLQLLTPRLTERRRPNQWLTRVRPAVGVGVIAIVTHQPTIQSFFEFGSTGKVAPLQESTTQDTEEQFYLVQPRTVNRSEMKHVLVTEVAQKRTTLLAGLQSCNVARDATAIGNPSADVEAPMRVEVVYNPIEAFHVRELRCDMVEMANPIDAGPRFTQIPNDLTGGYAEGRQQRPCSVANVLEFPLFDEAGLGWPRRIFSLENLHPGLLIAGKDQAAFFI
jgi:hypothetical protein